MSGLVRAVVVAAVVGPLSLVASTASAESIKADLSGYQEVPAVSTEGAGQLRAKVVDGGAAIEYELSYSGIQGDVMQAHFHIGRRATNGGISVWICANAPIAGPAGTPTCPQEGTVSGVITAASVVGPGETQQLGEGEFEEFLAAIRAGAVYANVHSSISPGGEIRGQLIKGSRREHSHR